MFQEGPHGDLAMIAGIQDEPANSLIARMPFKLRVYEVVLCASERAVTVGVPAGD